MNCKNCGAPINDGEKFCGNCGIAVEEPQVAQEAKVVETTPVVQEQTQVQTQQPVQNNTVDDPNGNANKLCIISLILCFGSSLISGVLTLLIPPLAKFFGMLAGLGPLAGVVLMIIARVKYPQNKFAKILMWVYIILIIIGIIGTILLVILCYTACNDLQGCE